MNINVYHTHIEVFPYEKGKYYELEKALSRWDQVSRKFGRYVPVAYAIKDDVLLLPKGTNIQMLENKFGCHATMMPTPSRFDRMQNQYNILYAPKDEVQEKAVSFLKSKTYCQYSLNLETSGGKTYCAINAFTSIGLKTLIIVNREQLSNHWAQEIKHFTNIPEDRIIQLNADKIRRVLESEIEGDVYIVLHQTIQSYARLNSWDDIYEFMQVAGIGIKIYDEAHEFINSTFVIDSHTDVFKTFYLSATFDRSDKKESKVFNLMLSSSYKFVDNIDEKDRKIHYIPILYYGGIPQQYIISMKTVKGFSSYRFIDMALEHDDTCSIIYAFRKAFQEALKHEGQILIVSPKKSTVEYFASMCERIVGDTKTIGKIYSSNTKESNLENQSCDIISSTIKSCGTGFNPPNLQSLICIEPHSSDLTTHQLKGRLDRFKGDDTYFYDIIDMSIPYMSKMYDAHKTSLSRFYKDFNEVWL